MLLIAFQKYYSPYQYYQTKIRFFVNGFMLSYLTPHSSQKRNFSEELVNAIKTRSAEDIQRLIDDPHCNLNAPLNIPDLIGVRKATALHMAIEFSATDSNESQSMIRMLLESGRCDVNAIDRDGRTPLHYAAIHISVVAAQLLIDNPECKLNVCDKLGGLTALQLTTRNLDPAIFNLILAHSGDRCNINYVAEDSKETILHFICNSVVPRQRAIPSSSVCDPLVSAFLKNGDFALWDAKNTAGDTALIQLLKERALSTIWPTLYALINSQKFDLGAVDSKGETPLHLAIRSSRVSPMPLVIDLLLSLPQTADCIINKKNINFDFTPLQLAIKMSTPDTDLIFKLIKHPLCDVNIISGSPDSTSALHLAIEKDLFSVVECLIASGKCDLLSRNDKGDTAFHQACYPKSKAKENCSIIRLLMSLGIYDVNAQNNKGYTPLMCSLGAWFQMPNFEKIRILIDNGADVEMVDGNGKNALYHLFVYNFSLMENKELMRQIVSLLFAAGIDTHSFSTWYGCRRVKHGALIIAIRAEGVSFQRSSQTAESNASLSQLSNRNYYHFCHTTPLFIAAVLVVWNLCQ